MKKTLIASSIAALLINVEVSADIAVTNMYIGADYAAGGVFLDAGGGSIYSVDNFFGKPWTGSQETFFMDNDDSWSGTTSQGPFDYDAVIAGMSASQVAVGFFWNWSDLNDIATLAIFDCVNNICISTAVPQDNNPFGWNFRFDGTGSGTPCPDLGDMNNDCKINLGDLILLQKEVLNSPN